MQVLFTPWRYSYISQSARPSGCFLCLAAAEPQAAERLVVASTREHVVLINRHPYSNGHLMIAPRQHWATPAESDPATQADFWPLVLRVCGVLAGAYQPAGFNLGMNLGTCAGAGVPDHYHFHVVPRWQGDTNFLSVLAETRLVPEAPNQSWERLRVLFAGKA